MSILEKMCLYLVSLYFLGTLMKLYTKYLAIIKAKKGSNDLTRYNIELTTSLLDIWPSCTSPVKTWNLDASLRCFDANTSVIDTLGTETDAILVCLAVELSWAGVGGFFSALVVVVVAETTLSVKEIADKVSMSKIQWPKNCSSFKSGPNWK